MDPIIYDLILSDMEQRLRQDGRKREPWHSGWERSEEQSHWQLKWRSPFVLLLTIVCFLAVLNGCDRASNVYASDPESAVGVAAEEAAPWWVKNGCASHAALEQGPVDAEITMVETATEVSHIGRTIWLGEAKTDFPLVTIEDTTVVLHADGSRATFEDVLDGICIQIVGRIAGFGEVRAQRIVLLDEHFPSESQHEEHRT